MRSVSKHTTKDHAGGIEIKTDTDCELPEGLRQKKEAAKSLCGSPEIIIETAEEDGTFMPTGNETGCDDMVALAFEEIKYERQKREDFMTPGRWKMLIAACIIFALINFLFAYDII